MKVILVLRHGWILVGDVSEEVDRRVWLRNACIIRRLGATTRLGQLALNGPTARTGLDPCGKIEVNPRAILFRIACDASKWS
jgi:hypothetical protein